MRVLLTIAGLALVLAGCQTTGGNSSRRVAIAGKPLKLGHYMSVNPDCTPAGAATIRVLSSPQNGSVSVRSGSDFPYFFRNNIRSNCNGRRVASQQLWYTGRVSGTTDQVTAEVIYSNGVARTSTYLIETR